MVEFESALSDVLLRAFADGAKLEGEWRIGLPVAEAPDWIVSITRVEPEGADGYEPSLIDE